VSQGLLPILHLLPLDNENKWSDLLAVLIEQDPRMAADILGFDPGPGITVARETALGRDRTDLLVYVRTVPAAVIEVKVLSGLGRDQLLRYQAAYPDAGSFLLLSLERLPVAATVPGWRNLSWEALLGSFTRSDVPVVKAMATEWVHHIETSVSELTGRTIWNALRDGESFNIAMHARIGWVYRQLDPPPGIEPWLSSSSAGRSWVVGLDAEAGLPNYTLRAEVEERLGVRDWPTTAEPGRPLIGPSLRVSLLRRGQRTSEGFDWDYLLALWPVLAAFRQDWVRTPANPKAACDKQAWKAMVEKGGPPYLGIGFGDAEARRTGTCIFGARVQLAPTSTLKEVAQTLAGATELLTRLKAVGPLNDGTT
jgi:hypothetical protein